jgi:2,5-diamino-6-(ribosylamino)-4(3H)-pyrimidinone 5'-phosphate reductase
MAVDNSTKVVMHNSVSLDGAFAGFEYSPELLGLHYQIAADFAAPVRLVGSNTACVSMEMFGGLTPETPADFVKPERSRDLSYWVVPDSRAVLQNKLHYFRRSEYCRDIAVLVAEETSRAYLEYLQERHYDYFVAGSRRVDLAKALTILADHYGPGPIMVDSGAGLTNVMLNQGLIDQISLLMVPVIVGKNAPTLFHGVERPLHLSRRASRTFPGGYTHVLYGVELSEGA